MLVTQSYRDIGRPQSLTLAGVYYDEIEADWTYSSVLHELVKRSEGKVVLNCEFKQLPSTHHPSHRKTRLSVTGDLYSGSLT